MFDEHDQSNLDFLLNASVEVLNKWYEQVDDDDLLYANELLIKYRKQIGMEYLH